MNASLTAAPTRSPAAPGPGPLSEPLLRALDLTVRRRVEGMLAGDHRSSLLGAGSELAAVTKEVREQVRQLCAKFPLPH